MCCIITILVVLVAFLTQAGYNASQRISLPYDDFPSPAEFLESRGGRVFDRPSDGHRLAYYQFGSKKANARVWVCVHGAVSTGGMFGIFPGLQAKLENLNVRMIAPTMPGWGVSDPYAPLSIVGQDFLDRFALDVVALMDSLEVDRFAVSGLSLGGTPSLAVAAAAAKQGRLTAVAALIPLMWSHAGFDLAMVGEYSVFSRVSMWVLQQRYSGALAAELMRRFVLSTEDDAWTSNPMLPNDVAWDRVMWGHDMQHAVRFQLVGQFQSNTLPNVASPQLFDWAAFDNSTPVHVFYGSIDDTVPPPVATYITKRLSWANVHEFEGGHFHLDIMDVIDTLF